MSYVTCRKYHPSVHTSRRIFVCFASQVACLNIHIVRVCGTAKLPHRHHHSHLIPLFELNPHLFHVGQAPGGNVEAECWYNGVEVSSFGANQRHIPEQGAVRHHHDEDHTCVGTFKLLAAVFLFVSCVQNGCG